ncbi:type I secretion system permease/ATPase [Novosphingobium sp. P6W]|uniref:type I secretion system permease/ATPase n=1 Tax=Novosphingobium sp. P6W TaxID=1609758 RepID=UPI000696430A|nr:type I secretion system permease/ATPase [Novosphingobium sp. P6W]AXB75544.1 type I secretion system permease/ATPase [Novosphingobium sp. P6W]
MKRPIDRARAASPKTRASTVLDPSHPDYNPRDEFAAALRNTKGMLWTAAGFSGAVNLLYLASPIYLIQVYNRVIPSGSMATLGALTIALMGALATMAVLDACRARILIRAAARIDRLLSNRVFQSIIDLSARHGAPARNARALRDLDEFRTALAGHGAQFFFDVPWMPLFILILFLIHWSMGLLGLTAAATLLAIAFFNDQRTRASAKSATEAAARSYQFTDSVARYADPVHAMGMDNALAERWQVDRSAMMREQAYASDRHANFTAALRFTRLMFQGLMLGLGGYLAVNHSVLPASIFAANMMLGRALAPLEVAVSGWRQIRAALGAGKRVQKILNEAPAPRRRVEPPFEGIDVDLSEVAFVPAGSKRPALRPLNLKIRAGEAIGIVGPSGAGKTCLARLIVGARLPSAGKLSIGGLDSRHWSREMLARNIGYLPQTVGLFPGTVRDNICRFAECEDDVVITAATRANVHQMILDLPEGYETRVDEGGSGLSGGQRQRIGLARALFGDPKLLVLDEPNAHLDADGEEALAGALEELKAGGATIVLIAHRLNPVAHVDRVVVLNCGVLQLDGPRQRVFRKVRTELVASIARDPVEGKAA